MSAIKELQPTQRLLVMNLLDQAGVDVSAWALGKGGARRAASNPKYCYNWSFEQPGKVVVLCLWHSGLTTERGKVIYRLNPKHRGALTRPAGVKDWNPRSGEINRLIRLAYTEHLPIRVILVDGQQGMNGEKTVVETRRLDPQSWAVTEYDFDTGKCLMVRGAAPVGPAAHTADIELSWFEGSKITAFVIHRTRELAARQAKIQDSKRRNGGKLICEVPKCKFDFAKRYGSLGEGYAQVHHLDALSSRPKRGNATRLTDLAVVCANCHVMIHIGGECRPLKDLIP